MATNHCVTESGRKFSAPLRVLCVSAFVPLPFVGMDPAVCSAPFVAMLVDVTGIVIFFNMAKTFCTFEVFLSWEPGL